jgi:hypothetical protein
MRADAVDRRAEHGSRCAFGAPTFQRAVKLSQVSPWSRDAAVFIAGVPASCSFGGTARVLRSHTPRPIFGPRGRVRPPPDSAARCASSVLHGSFAAWAPVARWTRRRPISRRAAASIGSPQPVTPSCHAWAMRVVARLLGADAAERLRGTPFCGFLIPVVDWARGPSPAAALCLLLPSCGAAIARVHRRPRERRYSAARAPQPPVAVRPRVTDGIACGCACA